ncbi:MAG: hypothetical protein ABS43_10405 [Bordetella sp. SCN 67-23]|nr:MAG: hypothetical protein ABS43_10405 [Bordetella sp. SCN 67-23]
MDGLMPARAAAVCETPCCTADATGAMLGAALVVACNSWLITPTAAPSVSRAFDRPGTPCMPSAAAGAAQAPAISATASTPALAAPPLPLVRAVSATATQHPSLWLHTVR